jgi:septum formation protein
MSAAQNPPRIVLASQSPRRAQLLELIGLAFDVEPADVDETYPGGEPPDEHARRLAVEKAQVVAQRCPEALVVGSDTVVVIEGELLGKPRDEAEALAMLMRLAGREHLVHTGIAVAAPPTPRVRGDGRAPGGAVAIALVAADVETVRVRFRAFDEATARAYIATGEPMDKAGAYGIQGYGATLVERIEGDYFAVMGLPIGRMLGLMQRLGWRYNFGGLEPA